MNQVYADFERVTGRVKPLHGVCCAPYSSGLGPNQRHIDTFFKEGNIPYCRLHDCCGTYGGSYFVDISNVFPNFDADENDPASYDFYYTDEYIGAIQKAGCETYYRLGETIEWGSKKYTSNPPKDFAKWARICEHIIMHYNEGWADGYHYNLTYWEIWNEPENPGNAWGRSQWTGTKEEFFELYKITSKHLRICFPNIKIGGYGSCGFYAVTRQESREYFQKFVTWFLDFLVFVKENECPLDFYSWHIYTGDEKELLAHAKYIRETLDEYGFTETESHLNEWNVQAEGAGFKEKHTLEGAGFNAAVLCMLQNTDYVDMAMYYCFSLAGKYNGFLDQNDGSVCPSWYPYVAFGNLYRLGNAVEISYEGNVYAAAAKNEDQYGIMVVNYSGEEEETLIHIKGISDTKTAQVLFVDDRHNLEEVFSFTIGKESDVKIRLPKQTVVYIKIEDKR
jgi:hypothetical protein